MAEGMKRYLGGFHVSSLVLSPEVVHVTFALNPLAQLFITLLNRKTTRKYHFTICPEGKIKRIVGQKTKKKKKPLVITTIYFKICF